MDNDKAGVAVFVKSKGRYTEQEEFKDIFAFGGRFENIASSLGYLQFLENRETEFYVQIGYVGWKKNT